MTSAWFLGAANSVPQNESEVRSTVDPVRSDGDTAQSNNAPDWNEGESDNSGQLTGLAQRTVASDTIESTHQVPVDLQLASAPRNILIDEQVSSSGTAAAREAAGQAGHGSMQFAIGIDPLNSAERFGNEYFVADGLSANEGSGNYMAPVSTDNWGPAVAAALANERARTARMSSVYQAWEM